MSDRLKLGRVANFECVIRDAAQVAPTAVVVLLHGYGANCHDLAPLADHLDPDGRMQWLFPNAPLKLPFSPFYDSRAWFQIDMDRLQYALQTGNVEYFAKEIPSGFLEARDQLNPFISAVSQQCQRLILGGFSQGSMLAGDLCFADAHQVDQLVLLSSTLVARSRWEDFLKVSSKKYRVFQSHGTQDPVLPYQGAVALKELLEHQQVDLEFHSFNNGHAIPGEILQKLSSFLL